MRHARRGREQPCKRTRMRNALLSPSTPCPVPVHAAGGCRVHPASHDAHDACQRLCNPHRPQAFLLVAPSRRVSVQHFCGQRTLCVLVKACRSVLLECVQGLYTRAAVYSRVSVRYPYKSSGPSASRMGDRDTGPPPRRSPHRVTARVSQCALPECDRSL